MKPSDISLFTSTEQTLLIATAPARLEGMSEADLVTLLGRVRRARNKYSDLHRRQGAGAIRSAGKRYAASTSNERTLRKAQVLDDAVARVSVFASRAARSAADALRDERLADASTRRSGARTPATRPLGTGRRPTDAGSAKRSHDIVSGRRVGATSAATRRAQSGKDTRRP